MYCKYCGKELPENSKFCSYCGNELQNNNAFTTGSGTYFTPPGTSQPDKCKVYDSSKTKTSCEKLHNYNTKILYDSVERNPVITQTVVPSRNRKKDRVNQTGFNLCCIILIAILLFLSVFVFYTTYSETQNLRDFIIEDVDAQYDMYEEHGKKYYTYQVTNNSDIDWNNCRIQVTLKDGNAPPTLRQLLSAFR